MTMSLGGVIEFLRYQFSFNWYKLRKFNNIYFFDKEKIKDNRIIGWWTWSWSRLWSHCSWINNKVLSSKPAQGEVYSIQLYVIKFVSDLHQVDCFLQVLRFPSPIKLIPQYNWNIAESGVKHHYPKAPKWHSL